MFAIVPTSDVVVPPTIAGRLHGFVRKMMGVGISGSETLSRWIMLSSRNSAEYPEIR